MKNLLYIGNKLEGENKTVSTIDTLSRYFKGEGFYVKTASSKSNKIIRLADMLWHIIINRKTTDYVLIDTYSTLNFYYAYVCGRLCKLLNLRYVPILHGGDLPKRLRKSPKLSKKLFRNAFINVAPSKYLFTKFKEEGVHNLVFIPNTIEINNYIYQERSIKDIRLLWVRSFSKIYNPGLAIEIVSDLKNEGYEAELCMVGPDKDGSLIETKALADKLNVKVTFTGKLEKQEWIELSNDYNIFINTTNVDNTPVSVIEAMALGLPVISTNVGGIPYLINNKVDGVLVEPNNVEAFVLAIKKLIEDKDMTIKITKNAKNKVENFDWNIVKKEWLKVLS
ncbi:glycosyltransferase family 4 protein [Seonamhaeicola marinus]|uniref:Glycosyltransferase family 4 protein n=1 Tax=Seonamhaeicola marinus TaxID=1912246 RepID=A0A5D0HJM3_9FLAO|nr:glycosyltransferase family 4 protein [Seonamhaeicola marinus]TYA71435.1 glycosyltransferase family 4 protein [Seonamhaeicola marinus]